MEKDLEKAKIPFLRIHQSYLVNYLLIKSRTKAEVTLVNGMKLPISEDRQKEFNRDYGKLLRGEINGYIVDELNGVYDSTLETKVSAFQQFMCLDNDPIVELV